jgi:hypothetical protein
MNRHQFLVSSSAGLAAATFTGRPAWARQSPTPPPTTFSHLRRSACDFTGQGGTIAYLINNDGAIAVDSQFPATAGPCVEGLKGMITS